MDDGLVYLFITGCLAEVTVFYFSILNHTDFILSGRPCLITIQRFSSLQYTKNW